MKFVDCPIKRCDNLQLRAELLAAGVPPWEFSPFSDLFVDGPTLRVRVHDDADEADVRRVVASHVPPAEKTPKQMRKDLARTSLKARTPERVADLARDKVAYNSAVETRNKINAVIAALKLAGILPANFQTLINRSFAELQAAAEAQVNAEVDAEPDAAVAPNT